MRAGVEILIGSAGAPRVIACSMNSFSMSLRGVDIACDTERVGDGGVKACIGGGSLSEKEKDEAAGETRPWSLTLTANGW